MERLTTSVIWLLLAVSFVNAMANDVPRQNEDDTMRYSNHAALDYCQERQPRVAHFLTVDPKADQYPGINPYLYCAGNPIRFVDPTGEFVLSFSTTFDAGICVGAGISATLRTVLAFDDYGVTQSTEYSLRYLINQHLEEGSNNPSVL